MRSPYFVLGVQPDASKEDIKSAFRRLAMAFHPDLNQDDFGAQERFAEINAAYQLLSDPHKRRLFDEGRIDGRGKQRSAAPGQPQAGASATAAGTASVRTGKTPDDVAESIFGSAFTRDGQPRRPAAGTTGAAKPAADKPKRTRLDETPGIDEVPLGEKEDLSAEQPAVERGARGWGLFDRAIKPLFSLLAGRDDEHRERRETALDLPVALEDVLSGAALTLDLPDGGSTVVDVAKGAADGATIWLRGQGPAGEDGSRGDLLVTLRYQRHPLFRVDGHDLHVEVPVGLEEAVFGTTATVATLGGGEIRVDVPEWSGSDRSIKLAGKGLPTADGGFGDLFCDIRILLSREPDEKLIDLLRLRRGEWYL